MRVNFVTVVNPVIWQLTAKRSVESFVRYWGKPLTVWTYQWEGPLPAMKGVTFKQLEDTPTFMQLAPYAKEMPVHMAQVPTALAGSAEQEADWLAYVDGAIEWMATPSPDHLAWIFDEKADVVTLQAGPNKETTGHFMAFNLRRPGGASILADFWGLYNAREAFQYKNAQPQAVLDRLLVLHRAHGLALKDLAAHVGDHDAFHQSLLGELGVAYVPPKFEEIFNPSHGQLHRYKNVAEVAVQAAQKMGRAKFVEVGTWNGGRAVHLAMEAFKAGFDKVEYVGFDTFEQEPDHQHEVNVKPVFFLATVEARLNNFARAMKRLGKTFSFKLVKGNTLVTLPKARAKVAGAAFAWIDGGHSEETVTSDYKNLKGVPYVLFDDVFKEDEEGAPKGPHRVWQKAAGTKQLIQTGDHGVAAKQSIGLGLVSKEGVEPLKLMSRIQVKPVDSVEKGEQFAHIAENSAALKEWMLPCQVHEKWGLMVSAGPSLPEFLLEIKRRQQQGDVIFAVKHAVPALLGAGVRPDFVVILDPRPVDGLSTHGFLRTDLFEGLGPQDCVLFATMTHPSVRHLLKEKGVRLVGWHAQTQITLDAGLPEFRKGLVVGGGTCSATRMPMLAYAMGFRRMAFYGYDFAYPEDTPQGSVKQPLMRIALGNPPNQKEFWTTGELIAAMQDLGQWNQWMLQNQLTVEWKGKGAGPTIWEQTVPNYVAPLEFRSLGPPKPEAQPR